MLLVVTCDDPGTPENGDRVTSDELNVDSIARFSCSHGYMLTGGDRVRLCNGSGDWTGAQPSCTRKLVHLVLIYQMSALIQEKEWKLITWGSEDKDVLLQHMGV